MQHNRFKSSRVLAAGSPEAVEVRGVTGAFLDVHQVALNQGVILIHGLDRNQVVALFKNGF